MAYQEAHQGRWARSQGLRNHPFDSRRHATVSNLQGATHAEEHPLTSCDTLTLISPLGDPLLVGRQTSGWYAAFSRARAMPMPPRGLLAGPYRRSHAAGRRDHGQGSTQRVLFQA